MLDAHFHLDHYKDPDRILDEIRANHITALAVSNNLTSYVQTRLLARDQRGVLVAAGFHPAEVAAREWELDQVLAVMELEPLIGEIGLDGKNKATRQRRTADEMRRQRSALQTILKVCHGRDKILSLHSQDAVRPLLEVISRYDLARVIWHWYLGILLYLDHPTHEDLAWFGIIFPFLFVPMLVYQTIKAIRKRDPIRFGLLILIFFANNLNLYTIVYYSIILWLYYAALSISGA